MEFRFPDNPTRISRDALMELDQEAPGTWVATPKYDGWRRPIYVHEDGRVTFHAKYADGREEAAKQPPPALVEEFKSLKWPKGIALDVEWMGTRMVEELKGEHHFQIFDLLAMNGQFLEAMPPAERVANLKTICELIRGKPIQGDKAKGIILPASDLSLTPHIHLVETVDRDLWRFFEELEKNNPLCEGIVIRHAQSRLIGDRWDATSNKLWHKCKWRNIKEATAF